ncbi:hypothetical protein QUF90_21825 [Desulfococcaceae bacterium HSG9]|nr:hypothetical protein [Desulfococcaceae bacterium HSG9]
MNRWFCILLSFFLTYIQLVNLSYGAKSTSKMQAVSSPPVKVLSHEEFNRRANQNWNSIPNKADFRYLDSFIKQFPASDMIPTAFTVRYNVVQAGQSIPDYNRFIATYPDTLAAQTALQEVFKLYADANRLPWYLDFIARYPNTPQALVAKMHAESLGFKIASLTDRIDAYDAFLETFPDAPQTLAAEKLAKQRAIDDERAWLAKEVEIIRENLKEKGNMGVLIADQRIREEVRSRSRSLVTDFQRTLTLYETVKEEKSADTERQKHQRFADRMAHIILEVYGDQDAADAVRQEARYKQLLTELKNIHQTIKENHQALVTTLQQEFQATRKALQQGFERLHLDNLDTRKSIDALTRSTEVLHQDLINVNQQLITLNRSVSDVGKKIVRTNELLDVLHNDLDSVNSNLVKLNNDLVKGFETQFKITKSLKQEVEQGFIQLHQDLEVQTKTFRDEAQATRTFIGQQHDQTRRKVTDVGQAIDETVRKEGSRTRDHTTYEAGKSRKHTTYEADKSRKHTTYEADKSRKHTTYEAGKSRKHTTYEADKIRKENQKRHDQTMASRRPSRGKSSNNPWNQVVSVVSGGIEYIGEGKISADIPDVKKIGGIINEGKEIYDRANRFRKEKLPSLPNLQDCEPSQFVDCAYSQWKGVLSAAEEAGVPVQELNKIFGGEYESNKDEKIQEVRGPKGPYEWKVALGDEINERDAGNGIVAAGVSIFEGGSSFALWAERLVADSITQMTKSLKELGNELMQDLQKRATEIAMEIISSALQNKQPDVSKIIKMANIEFKAGLIKYSGTNSYKLPGGDRNTASKTWGFIPYVALRMSPKPQ